MLLRSNPAWGPESCWCVAVTPLNDMQLTLLCDKVLVSGCLKLNLLLFCGEI